MITQLREVTARGLRMISIVADIRTPYSWKAFDQQGKLHNYDAIEKQLNIIINQLLEAHTT